MKKVLAIFLAFIIGLSMSAQIQNKLLGFTLGKTNRSEVYNKYKNDTYFIEKEDGSICSTDVTFAGHEWDMVVFNFVDNKLSAVAFSDIETETPVKIMESTWKSLKERLWNKYSKYYENTTDDMILYSDDTNKLVLRFSDSTGRLLLLLYYTNIALTVQQMQAEEDEL